MRMYDIIDKKKHGEALSKDEIEWFITSMMKNEVTAEQVSAFAMAVYFQGMNDDETFYLTMAMRDSGKVLDLSGINGLVVDKHSTGGVGDKTTLVLCPIFAACGAPIAKMSGRGLGHTGGTIDKMECIPGFNTSIDIDTFISNVNKIGIALAGQTEGLAPADKKIYAIRDTTATVDQSSLIASSIMSKKLASGAEGIVCDVKVGDGAFMKNESDARRLAELMVTIGEKCDRKTIAILTAMNEPLGNAVGNTLEVIEAIEALKGNGPEDLMKVVYTLGDAMLQLSGLCKNIEESYAKIDSVISDGSALTKFRLLVQSQGGDESIIDDTSKLPLASFSYDFLSEKEGYVQSVTAQHIGHACMLLGGGRAKKEDTINPGVGIVVHCKIADYVKKGEPLATIYYDDADLFETALAEVKDAITISSEKIDKPQIILGRI